MGGIEGDVGGYWWGMFSCEVFGFAAAPSSAAKILGQMQFFGGTKETRQAAFLGQSALKDNLLGTITVLGHLLEMI